MSATPVPPAKRQRRFSWGRTMFRVLVALAHRSYLVIIAVYLGIVIFRSIPTIENHGITGLRDGRTLLHVLLLTDLYDFMSPHWWVVIPILFGLAMVGVVLFFIWIAADSYLFDLQREPVRTALEERKVEWQESHSAQPLAVPAGFTLRCTVPRGEFAFPSVVGGERIVTAERYRADIQVWDARTGSKLQAIERTDSIDSAAVSADGDKLATGTFGGKIEVRSLGGNHGIRVLSGHTGTVNAVAWAPQGLRLASGSNDKTVRVWDADSGTILQILSGHETEVEHVVWSPDGQFIASSDRYEPGIRIWDLNSQQQVLLIADARFSSALAWAPNGQQIVSARLGAIHIWDAKTGRAVRSLEGHIDSVHNLAFSSDGRLLASVSSPSYSEYDYKPKWLKDSTAIHGGATTIWKCDTWERLATLPVFPFAHRGFEQRIPLAFIPGTHVLVTPGGDDDVLDVWALDEDSLTQAVAETPSLQYSNAKVVLMGDSGVGKSGLGLVLSGDPFVPTESTHGRHVWTLEETTIQIDSRRQEQREVLLWDLAGQPGYRLIHQLHLNEVTVAVVVFDARSETNPFAGVLHWDRALRQAQAVRGTAALPLKKLLVAARSDRGGIGVSIDRARQLAQELGFVNYIETSAKSGLNVPELQQAILANIAWDELPKATSTELFQEIKSYLVAEKEAGRVLATSDDLYRGMLQTGKVDPKAEALRAQFETCIGLVEARGLILRLSFGDLILLQPELLDAYASALINAVKEEPDGLGSIAEDRVMNCDFSMPADERLANRAQERLLLLAMIEDIVRRELAIREQTATGKYLIFPSQSTREHPDLPDPQGKMDIFRFQGPLQNIYATLAVRLSYSELFLKKDVWKDAITYAARAGGVCGIVLRTLAEGDGEVTLFSDNGASDETRSHFQEYVAAHLGRWAIPDSIKRIHVFSCKKCGEPVAPTTAERRRKMGFDWLTCPVCDSRVDLTYGVQLAMGTPDSQLVLMDNIVDIQRDRHTAAVIVQGKRAMNAFDVFLCHNNEDKADVKQIGEQLLQQAILPWLDEWELQPGLPWQRMLERQIADIRAAAVFVGREGIGPWQQVELEAFIRQFVERGCPVIPVILPECKSVPKLPTILGGMTWVDLRKTEPDPMERLIWGITGERPPLPLRTRASRHLAG